MKRFLETLIEEKNLSDTMIEVEGESGVNMIMIETLIEEILTAPLSEQKQIRKVLIKMDFNNDDVLHFFNHLAKTIAI